MMIGLTFQARPDLAAPSTRRLVESSVYCCKASWIKPRRRACRVDFATRDASFTIRSVMLVSDTHTPTCHHAAAHAIMSLDSDFFDDRGRMV
jgi:hypothetical protein